MVCPHGVSPPPPSAPPFCSGSPVPPRWRPSSESARHSVHAASRAPVPGADALLAQVKGLGDLGGVLAPVTDLLNAVLKADNGQLSAEEATKLGDAVKDAIAKATAAAPAVPAAPAAPVVPPTSTLPTLADASRRCPRTRRAHDSMAPAAGSGRASGRPRGRRAGRPPEGGRHAAQGGHLRRRRPGRPGGHGRADRARQRRRRHAAGRRTARSPTWPGCRRCRACPTCLLCRSGSLPASSRRVRCRPRVGLPAS